MTRTDKLKRRRELYLLKKDKINADRRAKYAVAIKSGMNYKQARDIRGYGSETITEKYTKIRYKEKTNVYYIYTPRPKKIEEVISKADLSNIRKKSQYKKARELGYSPKEARYLRSVAETKFNKLTEQSKPYDITDREKRWYRMNSKSNYDQSIIDAVADINIAEGYDPASRYGWAVYYNWYMFGGDIEGWMAYVTADPFNPDALGYEPKSKPVF